MMSDNDESSNSNGAAPLNELSDSDSDSVGVRELSDEKKRQQRIKQKQLDKLRTESAQYNKRGVVYISSIPSGTSPSQLKQLLSHAYNNVIIHRIYCQPINNISKHKLNKSGKESYLDGWIEFDNKHQAKQLCDLLNGSNIISSNRKNKSYDTLWNLKYLKGFKWNHLTDKLHSDRAKQSSLIRDELQLASSEAESYQRSVQLAEYTQRKFKRNNDSGDNHDRTHHRQFKQRKMIDEPS